MSDILLNHPVMQALIMVILTLVGKWFWDNYLSSSSRVTSEKCGLLQRLCKDEVMKEIDMKSKTSEDRINNLENRMDTIIIYLKVLLELNMEMCNKLKGSGVWVDCDKINRMLIAQGLDMSIDNE